MNETNQQAVITSGRGRINLRDVLQSAAAAGIGAVLSIASPLLEGGNLDLDWSRMWKLALGVAVVHIVRKLISPPVLVITQPPQHVVQAVKEGEATIKLSTPESAPLIIKTDDKSKQ